MFMFLCGLNYYQLLKRGLGIIVQLDYNDYTKIVVTMETKNTCPFLFLFQDKSIEFLVPACRFVFASFLTP